MSQPKNDPQLPNCVAVPPGFKLVTETRLVPDENYAPSTTPEASNASTPAPQPTEDDELVETSPEDAEDSTPNCKCPSLPPRGRK